MSAHTKGPWEVVHNSWEVSTVYAASGEVARCHLDSEVTEDTQESFEPIKEANARLIAAAPDFYEACKYIDADWTDAIGTPDSLVLAQGTREAWKKIRAALAKVESNS